MSPTPKVTTVYSQIYELKTGKIQLYQFHDFEHEVVLDLRAELARGTNILRISSLFPSNKKLDKWSFGQEYRWRSGYEGLINKNIQPSSQSWMSGGYLLQEEVDTPPVKVYLEKDQLYLERPNQLPIELYPTDSDTVFHHFFNGMDLTLTFHRNLWRQVTGAQGTSSFDPYEIAVPYNLSRPGSISFGVSVLITVAGVGILLILFGLLRSVRRRSQDS